MTWEQNPKRSNLYAKSLPRLGDALFGALAIFCFLLLLRNTDTAISFFSKGLLLCAQTVIPSLFPFMILAELLASSSWICRLLSRAAAPIGRLVGLSSMGATKLLLGMICGFPNGIRTAILAYRNQEISKQEAERIIALGSNPSAAFLIGTVGAVLFRDRGFGILLYVSLIVTALLIGAVTNRSSECQPIDPPISSFVAHGGIAKRLTNAVSGAVNGILLICAYVVFLGTLVGTVGLILEPLGLPPTFTAMLFSCFELSSGVSHAAMLEDSTAARILCALTVGWSGLSVHCQAISFCDDTNLSLRPYLRVKLLQSLLIGGLIGAVELLKRLLL